LAFGLMRTLWRAIAAACSIRHILPAERLFMTYLETEAMNRQFAEAEAVVFYRHGNRLF
jgi:hypothetical protein